MRKKCPENVISFSLHSYHHYQNTRYARVQEYQKQNKTTIGEFICQTLLQFHASKYFQFTLKWFQTAYAAIICYQVGLSQLKIY